jgi:hypothetical protein
MQHAKPRNTGVHCEGVKGATADFVCFHCPLLASAEAKPLHRKKQITNREINNKTSTQKTGMRFSRTPAFCFQGLLTPAQPR